jgi:hypothetical protein
MEEDWVAHIVLTLDTQRPIEIDDFVSAFTSIAFAALSRKLTNAS